MLALDELDQWEDFRSSCVQRLSESMAQNVDEILRVCLNRFLGRKDWKEEELVGRLHCVLPADKSSWTYYIDKTPLVVFFPIEYDMDGNIFKTSRKYKMMIGLEKEDVEQSR